MRYDTTIHTNIINFDELKNNSRRLGDGLLSPAKEETVCEIAPEHAAEPIKSMDDINAISRYLIANGRYRDNMLFIIGINFGLRASDLRLLRFSNLINENMTFRESFPVFEKKTRNTRKRKKNRYITINHAVIEAVSLYLEAERDRRAAAGEPPVSLSDYLFWNISNNNSLTHEPLTVRSIDRILKGVANDLGLTVKMSTHTLRKTFCYWTMVYGGNESRMLLLLQKMLNHSSPAQTLDYIGITTEEIAKAYNSLNLGMGAARGLVDSRLVEDGGSYVG